MYVNDEAHRVSIVSRPSPSFSLSSLFPSHTVIPSRSVLLSSRKFLSPFPVLSIGQTKLCSRDDDAEGDLLVRRRLSSKLAMPPSIQSWTQLARRWG